MPSPWNKRELLVKPNIDGFSFASVGCVAHLNDDIWLLAFTRRDELNHSCIFLARLEAREGVLTAYEESSPALTSGLQGNFDDSGVMTACFLRIDNSLMLYYTGWELRKTTPFSFSIGGACWTGDNSLLRVSAAPLLGRHKNAPLFQAAPSIMRVKEGFRMWFVTGIGWERDTGGSMHYITNVCHARSKDGVSWDPEPELLLAALPHEYAFGRPCVTKTGENYEMWYCHRGTADCPTYRMGYAISSDGLKWIRRDDEAGICPSKTGWDSEMICYPHVFSHAGWDYMLYNGNGYGQTGLGYATRKT